MDIAGICAESAQKESSSGTALVFGVIFCIYIFFDALLGFLTVGFKAWGPFAEQGVQKHDHKLLATHINARF